MLARLAPVRRGFQRDAHPKIEVPPRPSDGHGRQHRRNRVRWGRPTDAWFRRDDIAGIAIHRRRAKSNEIAAYCGGGNRESTAWGLALYGATHAALGTDSQMLCGAGVRHIGRTNMPKFNSYAAKDSEAW